MNSRTPWSIAAGCLFAAALLAWSVRAERTGANPVPLHNLRSPALYQDLYIANQTTDSITVYPAHADGNVAPRRSIAGSRTLLAAPASLAVDFLDTLYVANGTNILEFEPGARGNVRPQRVLAVPFAAAAITVVTALTVDDDLVVYAGVVSAQPGGQLTGYLLRYAPQDNVPSATYVEGNTGDDGLTLDSTGTRVLSAVNAFRSCAVTGVDAITKTFSASSRAETLVTDPALCLIRSIVDDRLKPSYLVTGTNFNGYVRYAEHAGTHPVPLTRVTSGPAGGFLALDVQHDVYDAAAFGNTVTVFGASATGAATPERIIAGPATQLAGIAGIAIGGFPLSTNLHEKSM